MDYTLQEVNRDNKSDWLGLREQLWPTTTTEGHTEEIEIILEEEDYTCMLAYDGANPVGFIEFSIHNRAVGCDSKNVGYLEGWFVLPDYRGKGVGKILMNAMESWAKAQGCKEIASDCEVSNDTSCAAHTALGFEKIGELVHFKKQI